MSEPSSPGGVLTWMPERSCWRSSRANVSVNGLNCPAFGFDVPALNDGVNGGLDGHAPPWPSQLTSNDEDGVASGVYGVLHGVRSDVPVNVPQVCGVAKPGAQPALELQLQVADRELRVFQELRRQLARRRVRVDRARDLLHDPGPLDLEVAVGTCSRPPRPGWCTGRSPAARGTHSPSTARASNGVVTFTVPSTDAFGHELSVFDSRSNCASVHACKPSPADGESDTPAGSVTVTYLNGGVASPCGSGFCGTFRSTAIPDGSSASVVSGCTAIDGVEMQLFTTRHPAPS